MKIPTPWITSNVRKRLKLDEARFTVTISRLDRTWNHYGETAEPSVPETRYEICVAKPPEGFQKRLRFEKFVEIEGSMNEFLVAEGLAIFAETIIATARGLKAEIDARLNPEPSTPTSVAPIETLGVPYIVKRFSFITLKVSGITIRVSLGITKKLQSKTLLWQGEKGVPLKKRSPNKRLSDLITLSQEFYIEVVEIDPNGNPVGNVYSQVFEKGVYTIRPDLKDWLRTIKNLSEVDIKTVAIKCDELQVEVEERFEKKPKEIDKKWKPK